MDEFSLAAQLFAGGASTVALVFLLRGQIHDLAVKLGGWWARREIGEDELLDRKAARIAKQDDDITKRLHHHIERLEARMEKVQIELERVRVLERKCQQDMLNLRAESSTTIARHDGELARLNQQNDWLSLQLTTLRKDYEGLGEAFRRSQQKIAEIESKVLK